METKTREQEAQEIVDKLLKDLDKTVSGNNMKVFVSALDSLSNEEILKMMNLAGQGGCKISQ